MLRSSMGRSLKMSILGGRKDEADEIGIAKVSATLVTLSTLSVEVGVCAVHVSERVSSCGLTNHW
jgi:hypothetical protein